MKNSQVRTEETQQDPNCGETAKVGEGSVAVVTMVDSLRSEED